MGGGLTANSHLNLVFVAVSFDEINMEDKGISENNQIIKDAIKSFI